MTRGSPDFQPWNALQRFSGTGGATPFEQKLTTPQNTPVGVPALQDIVLTKGFIAHIAIKFPSGPAGLLHVSLWNGAVKLFPGDPNQYFSGDNEMIEFYTEYDVPLVVGVYKLTIQGWNEDDSYEHGVLVRVWVIDLP